jgi:hypothetical protein
MGLLGNKVEKLKLRWVAAEYNWKGEVQDVDRLQQWKYLACNTTDLDLWVQYRLYEYILMSQLTDWCDSKTLEVFAGGTGS